MNEPRVTVFMPVYNTERYLDEAIQSILNQTYKDFEFLIINDGSTDGSLSIIESYAKLDNRIKVMSRENRGLPHTRNEGLNNARGEFMALMDSDDISLHDRLEKQIKFLDQNPNITACGTALKYFGDKKTTSKYESDPDLIKIKMLFKSAIANPTSVFRIETIREKNIKYCASDTYSQDYRFWVNLLWSGCQIQNIDDICFLYRWHSEQGSQKYKDIQKAIGNDVRCQQLTKFDIHLTEHELGLLFFDGSCDAINDISHKEVLVFIYETFYQLIDRNKVMKVYNQKKLEKYLNKKYASTCIMFGLNGIKYFYNNKLISDKVFLENIIITLRYTSRKIKRYSMIGN